MNKRRSLNFRYSRLSSIKDILAERRRLQRKSRKQAKRLARSWEQIEDSWMVADKIFDWGKKLFSSSLFVGLEYGLKAFSGFLSKRRN